MSAEAVRAYLRENPDGAGVPEIADATNRANPNVWLTLRRMPDAYIDRWVMSTGGYSPVWCVVVPPEHCPKPGGVA